MPFLPQDSTIHAYLSGSGMTPSYRCLFSGYETALIHAPLSVPWVNPICLHHFTPVQGPRDSIVSCLALKPGVMRQHCFKPSSKTVKDNPHSLLQVSLNLEPQESNLSFTLAHTLFQACTLHAYVPRLLVGSQFHCMNKLT